MNGLSETKLRLAPVPSVQTSGPRREGPRWKLPQYLRDGNWLRLYSKLIPGTAPFDKVAVIQILLFVKHPILAFPRDSDSTVWQS